MNYSGNERLKRYQLRYAAGTYWLLDMEQIGMPYKAPLQMNEVGADIWRLLRDGLAPEEIVGQLREEYDVEDTVLRKDVEVFLKALEEYGIKRS